MTLRALSLVCIHLALLLSVISIKAAEEADSTKAAKSQTETEQTKEVAPEFLARWKKIHYTLKKHAYETQQTRTASGVRGAEQEDTVLEKLYGTSSRIPGNLEIKNAIVQLEELIKADPKAKTVPEQKLWIAQCYAQLGETKKAEKAYRDLIVQHPKTEAAKLAQTALKKKPVTKPNKSKTKQ